MLKARVITALVLIPCFIAALFFLPYQAWMLMMLVVATIACWEWTNMASFDAVSKKCYVVILISFGLIVSFADSLKLYQLHSMSLMLGLFLSSLFWLFAVPLWLLSRKEIHSKILLAIVGYIVIIPTWFALVNLREISPWLLLAVMIAVWIADSAAYFAGKIYGKHKLAPLISPGKTWEGVVGAWLAVTVYGLIICLSFGYSYWFILGLWAIVILSILGDLLESLIKRHAGVKDSGNLLPGHGGVLDRIDGLTSTLPLVAGFVYFPHILASII
jgi:phosphatidate cytidylyltransferase